MLLFYHRHCLRLLPVTVALLLLTAYICIGALTISCLCLLLLLPSWSPSPTTGFCKVTGLFRPKGKPINEQPFPFYMNVPCQRWLPTPAIFRPTGDLAQKSICTRLSVYKHTPLLNARHTAFSNTLKFYVTDEIRSHWWLSPTHLTKSSWPLDG